MSTGPVIAGFRFVQHLGSGGFAHVFLYEQEWPRQRVAVKVVRPDVPLTEREKRLFASEADAMARLADHPYIVSVITAGITGPDQGSRPYLVMRYCPPPDLGVRVRQQPMAVPEAIATGIKLASAVETAHRAGILHRDIKPSNVLVTTYSEPALSDFGIAGRMADLHAESEVRISYPWTAPELLEGRSNGSVASDVYSLGATIWNLLVGRSPFSIPQGDNSTAALTARILHSAPPTTGRTDVPAALDRLLQQTLAKHPAHRPQSALELARSLQQIESGAGYARTAIAVEAGQESAGGVASGEDGDLTAVKPLSVVSQSGPRSSSRHAGAAEGPGDSRFGAAARQDDDEPEALSRSGLVWTVVGVVVLAAIAAALFVLPGGGDEAPEERATASAPPSDDDLAVDAPRDTPEITAERVAGGRVQFAWTSGDVRGGDTWEYDVPTTGESARTGETTLVVPLAEGERTCVSVRQIREGLTSPWGNRCLE